MSLVHKEFVLDGSIIFDCFVFVDVNNYLWFKAFDIIEFLEFSKPRKIILSLVDPDYRQTWSQLKLQFNQQYSIEIPNTWSDNLLFIATPAVYMLIAHASSVQRSKCFMNWLMDAVVNPLHAESKMKKLIEERDFLHNSLKRLVRQLDECESIILRHRTEIAALKTQAIQHHIHLLQYDNIWYVRLNEIFFQYKEIYFTSFPFLYDDIYDI